MNISSAVPNDDNDQTNQELAEQSHKITQTELHHSATSENLEHSGLKYEKSAI